MTEAASEAYKDALRSEKSDRELLPEARFTRTRAAPRDMHKKLRARRSLAEDTARTRAFATSATSGSRSAGIKLATDHDDQRRVPHDRDHDRAPLGQGSG